MLLGMNTLGIGHKPVPFKPWLSSRCVAWFDPASVQTYDTSLYATGTTPPALTLSGIQTLFSPIGLRVECTSIAGGAARGLWALRYSLDSGGTWLASGVTSAATIALGGAATGLTLNIAAGNAATNNVWQIATSSIRSRQDSSKFLISATSAQSALLLTGASGILGMPAWADRNALTELVCSTQPIPGTPFFIYCVAQMNSGTGSFGSIFSGGLGGGIIPRVDNNGSGSNQLVASNGTSYVAAYTYGAPKQIILNCQASAGSDSLQVGSVTTTGAGLSASSAGTGLSLFVRYDLNAVTHLQGKIGLMGIFTGSPATGNLLTAIQSYVSQYGYSGSAAALRT